MAARSSSALGTSTSKPLAQHVDGGFAHASVIFGGTAVEADDFAGGVTFGWGRVLQPTGLKLCARIWAGCIGDNTIASPSASAHFVTLRTPLPGTAAGPTAQPFRPAIALLLRAAG